MTSLKKRRLDTDLSKLVLEQGFVRRGNAFFRVTGDGILQVAKFEYERVVEDYLLYIGAFSLYDELMEQWFTSRDCIPKYSMDEFFKWEERKRFSWKELLEMQTDIFVEKGLPWLNNMKTQKDIADGICWLDMLRYNSICWIDTVKIVPFLMSGESEKSLRILSEYLRLNCSAAYLRLKRDGIVTESNEGLWMETWPEGVWQEKEIERYEKLFPGEDDYGLLRRYKMIKRGNEKEIQEYLMKNYEQNMKYAAFCFEKKKKEKQSLRSKVSIQKS